MQDQKNQEVETETITTEEEAQEVSQPEAPQFKTGEIVEVEWEKVEQIFKVNVYSQQLENELAGLCLQHEKNKQNLLTKISECETFLFAQGSTLKDSEGIDPVLTYELKLPSQQGEKAFFIRKDTNQ